MRRTTAKDGGRTPVVQTWVKTGIRYLLGASRPRVSISATAVAAVVLAAAVPLVAEKCSSDIRANAKN